jgi:hypothetical protein
MQASHSTVYLLNNEHKCKGGIRDICPAQRFFCRSVSKTKRVRFEEGVKDDGIEKDKLEYAESVIATFNTLATSLFSNDINNAKKSTQNIELIQYYISECEKSFKKFDDLEEENLELLRESLFSSKEKELEDFSAEETLFFRKWLSPMFEIQAKRRSMEYVIPIPMTPSYKKGSLRFGLIHKQSFIKLLIFLKDYEQELLSTL